MRQGRKWLLTYAANVARQKRREIYGEFAGIDN